ncbi:MAG: hypothetical protein WC595_03785 [Candidatus Nanoarchaeia archaeon]
MPAKETDYEVLKARFLEAYANVPGPLRKEIIAVIGNETFAWNTARAEILNNTKSAKVILSHLSKMEVI